MEEIIAIMPDYATCIKTLTTANQVTGWLLTVGTFGSFVPQMWSLLVEKNLDGLAALSWALNYLSNMNTLINAFILQFVYIQCCHELSTLKCIGNLVPLLQLAMPAISTFIIFMLTSMYANRLTEPQKIREQELQANKRKSLASYFEFVFESNSFVRPLFIVSLFITFGCVVAGVLLMVFLGVTARATVLYADVVGIMAVLFLMVMYVPQLYTTFKVKHTGTLSVLTLMIQCPGSLAVVYFDFFQNHMSWTTWAPYLVSAVQQFVLIIMCFYYKKNTKQYVAEKERLLASSSSSLSPSLSSDTGDEKPINN